MRSIARLQQRSIALENVIGRDSQAHELQMRRDAETSAFLDNPLDGIQQIDADLTIRSANNAMLQIVGYKSEDYIGHWISEFFGGDLDDGDEWYTINDD